jgi:uncharacterized protein (UPF0305 family)
MGILEELAIVRDMVEKGELDNRGLIQEVEKIAKGHHDNIVVLYEGESFDEFKRYWISTLLGLRSLVELLQSEADDISLQEGLYPAALLSYFLKEAHLYVRTENGTKIAESIFLMMARILKPLKKIEVTEAHDIKTCMDLTTTVLSGIEAYKRKSYRQVYILPELNVMLQKTLQSYAEGLQANTLTLDDELIEDLSVMFKLVTSMFQNEENVSAILAKEVKAIVKAVKHAASNPQSTDQKSKSSKKKSQKSVSLSSECT